jgi:ribose transport system substrate-binding protein
VSALILAPSDRQTMVAPVTAALRKHIPVVIIDSGLEESAAITESKDYLGYVATDNELGGRKAAQHLAELLKDRPEARVLMLPYQTGSQSTELREKGFQAEIKKYPNITLIVSPEEALATVKSAQEAAERQLSNYPDLDGVFTPNESSTIGMLRALQSSKRAGKVKLVGFDSSDILISALRAGEIHGLVLQDPFDMGYQSVRRAAAFLHGTRPDNLVLNTNLQVVTRENMDSPEIRKLYQPDLSWLEQE